MNVSQKKLILQSTQERIIDYIQYHGQARAYDLEKNTAAE